MPTKTVVFTGYRKYDDATGGMRMLNTDEYIQMAGRAGRRGKDDRGLVLYLPDREPESLEDVKRMMTGGRATFQSRMTFGYDFLLKTLQSGNLDWLTLMRQSYWFKKLEGQRAAAAAELAAAKAAQTALGITDAELDALADRDDLQATLRGATNAARKKAQAALSAWENQHFGARWTKLQKELGPAWLKLNREMGALEDELAAMDDYTSAVWRRLWTLARMGFLEEPAAAAAAVAPPTPFEPVLTPLGTAATEVNEGHPLLLPAAYVAGAFRSLSAHEVLATLAVFLGESRGEQPPPFESLAVPTVVSAALAEVRSQATRLEGLERSIAASEVTDYWQLNPAWVEPVWRWLGGATAGELCTDYGLYEGNLLRMLLKMGNLLEELRNIATLRSDVEFLEVLRGVETELLRDVAVADSLYLRI